MQTGLSIVLIEDIQHNVKGKDFSCAITKLIKKTTKKQKPKQYLVFSQER